VCKSGHHSDAFSNRAGGGGFRVLPYLSRQPLVSVSIPTMVGIPAYDSGHMGQGFSEDSEIAGANHAEIHLLLPQ
jgi:hypothetical protein